MAAGVPGCREALAIGHLKNVAGLLGEATNERSAQGKYKDTAAFLRNWERRRLFHGQDRQLITTHCVLIEMALDARIPTSKSSDPISTSRNNHKSLTYKHIQPVSEVGIFGPLLPFPHIWLSPERRVELAHVRGAKHPRLRNSLCTSG
jgi:hypothetical protein